MRALSRAQVRAIDAALAVEFGMPSMLLMENAGLGATLAMLADFPNAQPIAVLAGSGNNGGDGYVLARQLALRSVPVRVFATRAELSGDARLMRHLAEASGVVLEPVTNDAEVDAALAAWRSTGLFVDALLGTGAIGALRPGIARVLRAVAAVRAKSGAKLVALDLPSGLDADSGLAAPETLRADATYTFLARKRGFDAPESAAFTGRVRVVPIGAPPAALEAILARLESR